MQTKTVFVMAGGGGEGPFFKQKDLDFYYYKKMNGGQEFHLQICC